MSIQRWHQCRQCGMVKDVPGHAHDEYGRYEDHGPYWISEADHVAALLTQDRQHMEELAVKVAEARDEGFPKRWEAAAQVEKAEQSGWHRGWRAGRADALAAAVAAVEALYAERLASEILASEVIAAIKGVGK